MNSSYTATLSSAASEDFTFNTITGGTPGPVTDPSFLSTDNYPDTSNSSPNPENQEIFKNLPLSWWISSINAGILKIKSINPNVKWVYVTPTSDDIHIISTITSIIIPEKIITSSTNNETGEITSILNDNNYLCMTRSMPMPWLRRPPLDIRNRVDISKS